MKQSWARAVAFFVAGTLVGAVSAVQLASRSLTTATVAQDTETASLPQLDGKPATTEAANKRTTASQAFAASGQLPPGVLCAAGRNGGATDVGVTADKIKLATTTVQSGIGAAFLGDVKYAMEAVKNKVNRAGGICGRFLDITYVDDGWDASRGTNDLQNFIKGGYFAIPVGPSSEGLRVVIDNGDIDRAGIPVVGTDGMLIDQYTDPWVWSVAVATASSARIMAINAYKRGARHFSIVFDKDYRFGAEAARAYNSEVRRLTHNDVDGYNKDNNCVRSYCGIIAGSSGYATQVNQFEKADYVAMFLEPQTALTWMATPGAPQPATTKYGVGAAQPLFTRDFATNCQAACDQMWVWTGYRPPIEQYESEAAVRTFVNDLKITKRDADVDNAFAEGGYAGMVLLVEALKKVGPIVQRAALKAVLDSMTLRSGLALQDALTWSPGNHFANSTMQAFAIDWKGTLGGWRAQDIERDPSPSLGVN